MPHSHDLALVKRSISGDYQAFHSLVAENIDYLREQSLSLAQDQNLAHKILHATVTEAFNNLAHYRNLCSIAEWMQAIMTRQLCLQLRFANQDVRYLYTFDDNSKECDDWRATFTGKIKKNPGRLRHIAEALQQVDANARSLAILHLIEGHSLDELAFLVGTTTQTLQQRLQFLNDIIR